MRKLFMLFCMALLALSAYSQSADFSWANAGGGTGTMIAYGVTSDADRNVIVTGYIKGTCDFGGIQRTSAGQQDIFVAKYNRGGVLKWAKVFGGSANDVGKSIVADAAGNIYVIGSFHNTMDFGAGFPLTSKGISDVFFTKIDKDGVTKWAFNAGSAEADFGEDIAIDLAGNLIITGLFRSSFELQGTTHVSSGGEDIFVGKLDPNGFSVWSKKMGGTLGDVGYGVATDENNDVFVTGFFAGQASIGGTNVNTSGHKDVFVCKFSETGTFSWVKTATSGSTNFEEAKAITTDQNGNVTICGTFDGTSINFGGQTLSGSGKQDMFIAQYKPNGDLNWAKNYGGSQYDYAYDLDADLNGNLLVTGGFGGTVMFGTTSLTSKNAGTEDLFLLKLDASGTEKWIKQVGSSKSSADYVWGESAHFDAKGNSIVVGSFEGIATFGSISLTSKGGDEQYGEDLFIAKVEEVSDPAVGISEMISNLREMAIFPNPSNGLINIQIPQAGNYKINIYNLMGQLNYSKQITTGKPNHAIILDHLNIGHYFIKIQSKEISNIQYSNFFSIF